MMMIEKYNFYIVAEKSLVYNSIKIMGVFPNERLAYQFRSVFAPKLKVYLVGKSQLKIGDNGFECALSSAKPLK